MSAKEADEIPEEVHHEQNQVDETIEQPLLEGSSPSELPDTDGWQQSNSLSASSSSATSVMGKPIARQNLTDEQAFRAAAEDVAAHLLSVSGDPQNTPDGLSSELSREMFAPNDADAPPLIVSGAEPLPVSSAQLPETHPDTSPEERSLIQALQGKNIPFNQLPDAQTLALGMARYWVKRGEPAEQLAATILAKK